MQLWSFILLICAGFLGIGAVIDFIAKRKNLHLDPEEGLKNTSTSEQLLKEQHLKQTIDEFNNPYS